MQRSPACFTRSISPREAVSDSIEPTLKSFARGGVECWVAVGVGGLWNVYPHHRERAGGVGRVRQVNLRLSNCSTLGVAKNWGRGGDLILGSL